MRAKRLYRAIAWYDGTFEKRHFQTKRARDAWAKQRLEGYDAMDPLTWDDDGREAIPPALRVDVADSEPIIFLVDYPEGLRAVNDES
jgi:hypothetical protein